MHLNDKKYLEYQGVNVMKNGKEVKNSKEWNTLHCPNTYHLYEEDQFGKYAAEKIALKYCSLEKRNMLQME